MTMTIILLVASFFLAMGLVALARPERIVAYFGTTSLTRDGRNEVRAVYGGFGVAIAILLAFSLGLPALRAGILACVAVALGGMAIGRLVSTLLDRGAGFHAWLFFGLEVLLAALLVAALRSL